MGCIGVSFVPSTNKLDDRLIQYIARGVPAKEIAREIKRPLSFVYYKIERLKRMGIVERTGYTINYKALGYNINAVLIARVTRSLIPPSLKYRSPVEAVLAEQTPGMVVEYVGSAENRSIIVINALFKGIHEIDVFEKSLRRLFDVRSVDRYLIAERRPE